MWLNHELNFRNLILLVRADGRSQSRRELKRVVLTMSKGKPWSETRLRTHVWLLVLRNTWGEGRSQPPAQVSPWLCPEWQIPSPAPELAQLTQGEEMTSR